jgi:hypothetical protein
MLGPKISPWDWAPPQFSTRETSEQQPALTLGLAGARSWNLLLPQIDKAAVLPVNFPPAVVCYFAMTFFVIFLLKSNPTHVLQLFTFSY